MISFLEPDETKWFQSAFKDDGEHLDVHHLSMDGQTVYSLLTAQDEEGAEAALHSLPPIMQERLAALSPINYLKDIHAPLIVQLHDRGDQVIPVGEFSASILCSCRTCRGALHRDAVSAS